MEELGRAIKMPSLLNFYWNNWEIRLRRQGGIRKDRPKKVSINAFALVSQYVLTRAGHR
jgi:hypothetical protein